MIVVEAVGFDVDGCLCESKRPIAREIAAAIAGLADRAAVAFVTGAGNEQVRRQVLDLVPWGLRGRSRARALAQSGAVEIAWSDESSGWEVACAERINPVEASAIAATMLRIVPAFLAFPRTTWGARIEHRGAQVTFSALGQDAPLDAKAAWKAEHDEARRAFARALAIALPAFDVRVGGTTSIDVTRRGFGKGAAFSRFLAGAGVEPGRAVFFGDELGPGGNDEPLRSIAGLRCVSVAGPEAVLSAINALERKC